MAVQQEGREDADGDVDIDVLTLEAGELNLGHSVVLHWHNGHEPR